MQALLKCKCHTIHICSCCHVSIIGSPRSRILMYRALSAISQSPILCFTKDNLLIFMSPSMRLRRIRSIIKPGSYQQYALGWRAGTSVIRHAYTCIRLFVILLSPLMAAYTHDRNAPVGHGARSLPLQPFILQHSYMSLI